MPTPYLHGGIGHLDTAAACGQRTEKPPPYAGGSLYVSRRAWGDMVVEARLRVHHPGCYSEQIPEGTRLIHVSSDEGRCLSVIRADTAEDMERLFDEVPEIVDRSHIIERGGTWVVARCRCEPYGITDRIQSMGCSVVYPVIETEGLEHYTVLAPSRSRLQSTVEHLEEGNTVHVDQVQEVHGDALDVRVSLSSVTGELTPRQLEALLLAVREGYYETPRRVEADELATRLGIGRSTFQEHLRKAERALLGEFASIVGEHPALEDAAAKGPGRPPEG